MIETYTPPRKWTEKEDAFLHKWAGRYSMRKIGASLGRTKNAVVGRAYRLKIVTGYRKFVK